MLCCCESVLAVLCSAAWKSADSHIVSQPVAEDYTGTQSPACKENPMALTRTWSHLLCSLDDRHYPQTSRGFEEAAMGTGH